jgi:hypothetical protein
MKEFFAFLLGISLFANTASAVTKLNGVTIDSISNLSSIKTSLSKLSRPATARIVFDEGMGPSYYKNATTQLSSVANVMGELLDSYYVKSFSVAAYKQRTTNYVNALRSTVHIWEIGNEINGEWLGTTSNVVAKMTGAYDIVKGKGLRTALTLYYNDQCWSKPSNEMFTWANKNVPTRMKQGLDYVFISFYEDDCNGIKPDWQGVFERLGRMFPNAKIGFGEVGTKYASRKEEYIKRYYRMQINHPRYVGGYFWWYFKQDMVPYTKPLWGVLNNAIR